MMGNYLCRKWVLALLLNGALEDEILYIGHQLYQMISILILFITLLLHQKRGLYHLLCPSAA